MRDEDHIKTFAEGDSFCLPSRQFTWNRCDEFLILVFEAKHPYLPALYRGNHSLKVQNT